MFLKASFLFRSAVAALIGAAAVAQIQPGWAVYSRLHSAANGTSLGGLTTFHPYRGAFAQITGLPTALVGQFASLGGSSCVLVRDADGSVVVGVTSQFGPVEIFHLGLNGSAVITTRRFVVGNSAGTRAVVVQMAWMGSDQVVLHTADAPVLHRVWGILNLTTGAVAFLPLNPAPTGTINALTVNRAGTVAYVGTISPNGIWSVPIPGGGTAMLVATLTRGMYQLDIDQNGLLYTSTYPSGIYTIQGGIATLICNLRQPNAMTIDRVSGALVVASAPAQTAPRLSTMHRWSSAGGLVSVTGMPALDAASGLAVRNSMVTIGTQSGGSVPYSWQIAPNPGGVPLCAGSPGFALTLSTTANPVVSVIGFSASPLQPPVPIGSAMLRINPVLVRFMSGRPPFVFPMSLPANPAFCNQSIFAQTLHLEGSGYVSSPVLKITAF